MCELVIKLSSGKEITVSRELLEVINKYIRFEYTLEKLAKDLALESWDEAYEFVKKLPAWLAWMPPSFYEYQKNSLCRELEGSS